ncbi:tetratricopeptide repeat protein [Mucilaginibacter sp. CSA2-8R]|uniref:tetratricopeptide repeat protein n=1 Tax=Mucilaginibacter sp. CSA2-8R TaxID=3141542 RepID=UPI00315DFB79
MLKIIKSMVMMLLFALIAYNVCAQDTRTLINEGNQLSANRDYTSAIEKYKAALATEADNITAKYQLGFALNAVGKGQEAIPYLQAAAKSGNTAAIKSSAMGLLGSIYDRANQPKLAIPNYIEAIKLDSANYALQYGLGLAYFRDHQYDDAERAAVKALSLDHSAAPSMRLYALVTFHQNKRAPALLGLLTFLWMEPTGTHAAEANENMQHILDGSVLKPDPGTQPVRLSTSHATLNAAIIKAVNTVAQQKPAASDVFAQQLKYILIALNQQGNGQIAGSAFTSQLLSFYYNLAQSPHINAFAHYIKQGVSKTDLAWVTAHPQQLLALKEWVKNNGQPIIR